MLWISASRKFPCCRQHGFSGNQHGYNHNSCDRHRSLHRHHQHDCIRRQRDCVHHLHNKRCKYVWSVLTQMLIVLVYRHSSYKARFKRACRSVFSGADERFHDWGLRPRTDPFLLGRTDALHSNAATICSSRSSWLSTDQLKPSWWYDATAEPPADQSSAKVTFRRRLTRKQISTCLSQT